MKTKLFLWTLIFAAVDFAIGYFGTHSTWWVVAVPTFLVAALVDSRFGPRVVWTSVIGAMIAWFGMGLYFDAPTGFRLSLRIAGIMGLHGWFFAYCATGLIVGVATGLAAYAGQNLRAGILQRTQPV